MSKSEVSGVNCNHLVLDWVSWRDRYWGLFFEFIEVNWGNFFLLIFRRFWKIVVKAVSAGSNDEPSGILLQIADTSLSISIILPAFRFYLGVSSFVSFDDHVVVNKSCDVFVGYDENLRKRFLHR